MKEVSSASQSAATQKRDYVAVDILKARAPAVLHRVATQVRGAPQAEANGSTQIYEPVLVSLGPYHHGRPLLQQVEALKPEILRLLLSHNCLHQKDLLNEIRIRLHQVRTFYGDLPQHKFDDDALADMMLRDACFLIYCLTNINHDHDCLLLARLGLSRLAFLVRDFFMWENQLPFFLLQSLIPFLCRKSLTDKSVDEFFYELVSSLLNCGDSCSHNALSEIPQAQISHLLDACRTVLVYNGKEKAAGTVEKKKPAAAASSQFRSVTDLKAKGIHFRPTKSKSYCLTEIDFRSHSFYGMLRLPILLVDNKTNVILSNLIAMEMSAGSGTDFAVTSYVKFMKSLIVRAEDMKELREKGIVVSCVANDDEVVRMFMDLNTEGSCRKDIFRGVRERINEHCRSKTKTFKAELLYTYFRSPWTAIALFAAVLLLCINCLNFLLNYYKFTHPIRRP